MYFWTCASYVPSPVKNRSQIFKFRYFSDFNISNWQTSLPSYYKIRLDFYFRFNLPPSHGGSVVFLLYQLKRKLSKSVFAEIIINVTARRLTDTHKRTRMRTIVSVKSVAIFENCRILVEKTPSFTIFILLSACNSQRRVNQWPFIVTFRRHGCALSFNSQSPIIEPVLSLTLFHIYSCVYANTLAEVDIPFYGTHTPADNRLGRMFTEQHASRLSFYVLILIFW